MHAGICGKVQMFELLWGKFVRASVDREEIWQFD